MSYYKPAIERLRKLQQLSYITLQCQKIPGLIIDLIQCRNPGIIKSFKACNP